MGKLWAMMYQKGIAPGTTYRTSTIFKNNLKKHKKITGTSRPRFNTSNHLSDSIMAPNIYVQWEKLCIE